MKVKALVRGIDARTVAGEQRTYLQVETDEPLQLHEVNITKQNAAVISNLSQLKGKMVLLALEVRQFNGALFYSLVNGGNPEMVETKPFVSAVPNVAKTGT